MSCGLLFGVESICAPSGTTLTVVGAKLCFEICTALAKVLGVCEISEPNIFGRNGAFMFTTNSQATKDTILADDSLLEGDLDVKVHGIRVRLGIRTVFVRTLGGGSIVVAYFVGSWQEGVITFNSKGRFLVWCKVEFRHLVNDRAD